MDSINPPQQPPMQPVEASIPVPKEPSSFFSFFKKLPFLIGVAIILIAGLGTGGFFLAKQQVHTATTKVSPTSVPTPIPNPTANWPVYTNSVINLTMKYPPSWKIIFSQAPKDFNILSSSQPIVDIVPPDYPQDPSGVLFGGVFVQIVKRDHSLSLADWVDQHGYILDTTSPTKPTSITLTVNNHQALKQMFTQTQESYNRALNGAHGGPLPVGYKSEYVYVDDGDFILVFEASGHVKNPDPDLRLFDQMLSTLTFTPLFIQPTPVGQATYTDKYFGYSLSYPKTWIFRRTYGPDMQKGAPTDILSGIDLTYNTGAGNNIMTQATIVVNMLDSHGLTDVQTWISQYDLNYPKNATKTHTTFNNLPAIQYGNFMESDHPTEYIYFISGKYMYRLMYWEDAGISDSTRAIVNSFTPGK